MTPRCSTNLSSRQQQHRLKIDNLVPVWRNLTLPNTYGLMKSSFISFVHATEFIMIYNLIRLDHKMDDLKAQERAIVVQALYNEYI
jgi:hypothetical protein